MSPTAPPLHAGPDAAADGPATPPAGSSAVNERVAHLFRVSLKDGRIHPLYLPVLKYRQVQHPA